MNQREFYEFYAALQWSLAHEYERLLPKGLLPPFVEKMPVDDAERLRRAESTILSLRNQAARWDGLVFSSK